MTYYHCTKSAFARMIESNGFTTDYSWESFLRYAADYARLYREPERVEEVQRMQRFFNEATSHGDREGALRWQRELDRFRQEWLRDWGNGTMIWVSVETNPAFGEICFEVEKPLGTIELMKDFLWWVPGSSIPPFFFKRIA